MLLTKTYTQENGTKLILSVDFNRKDKCVDKIISAMLIIDDIVQTDIKDILFKTFSLDMVVDSIKWMEVFEETIKEIYAKA